MEEIKQIKWYKELLAHCEKYRTRVIDKRNHLVILENWELVEFNV